MNKTTHVLKTISKALLVTLAAGAFGVLGGLAQANVSIKNGNFFIGYTDVLYSGGLEPKIERVFNSKTSYRGVFGPGWGNEYEVSLSVSADGSVVVKEYGGGAENRFVPTTFKKADLDNAVNAIAAAARKMGGIGTEAQLKDYKRRLTEDAGFRNDEWEKLRARGQLPARAVAVGTQFQSNRFSYQYITRTKTGYLRVFDNGRTETFDDSGRLTTIADRNGNRITFQYRKDGVLQSLSDNLNRRMAFSFNSKGLLERIDADGGKRVEYAYNDKDQLVRSKDVEGNVYTYKYDARNNMVEIGYSDKTTLQVAYFGPDQKDNVRSVKDRDGSITEYSYKNPGTDQIAVGVVVKTSDGKVASNSTYQYTIKRRKDGEEWTQRLVSVVDGDQTDTIYNECCGLPIQIRRGKDVTQFEYDRRGNVTKKTTPSEITQLSYDPKSNKVSRVVRIPKNNPKRQSWSQFQYDAKGNLVFARNSDKKAVRLVYDTSGRIGSIVDHEKRQLLFKYNEASKPIEIRDPKLGAITVKYKSSGEVDSVDSSAGRQVALQVTTAFKNLLDIIRPAGVSLSF